MRSLLFRMLLACGLGLGLLAQAPAKPAGPEELVRETTERMLEALTERKEALESDPGRLYDLVADIVVPHFDFETMARWVLGKHARRASETQVERFAEEFRRLLVRTYGKALLEYTGQEIRYLPVRMSGETEEVTVRTEVEQPGGLPIPIYYDMRRTGDGWKVFDLSIDGVSLVANYRTSFSNEIQREGLDGLIDTLARRNARATQ